MRAPSALLLAFVARVRRTFVLSTTCNTRYSTLGPPAALDSKAPISFCSRGNTETVYGAAMDSCAGSASSLAPLLTGLATISTTNMSLSMALIASAN